MTVRCDEEAMLWSYSPKLCLLKLDLGKKCSKLHKHIFKTIFSNVLQ